MKSHPRHAALREFESADRAGAVDARLNRHLAECRRCQHAVRRIRSIRTGAAELLGPPSPADSWAAIEARLDRGDAVLLPDAGTPPGNRSFGARHVAALFLLTGAGAVAALTAPAAATWAVGLFEDPSPAAPVPEAGIATTPHSPDVLVTLIGNTSDVIVRTRPSRTPLLEVKGRGAAAEAEFVIAGETIEVVGASGGEILLLVPEGITARLATGRSVVVLTDSADIVVPAAGERP